MYGSAAKSTGACPFITVVFVMIVIVNGDVKLSQWKRVCSCSDRAESVEIYAMLSESEVY